MIQKIRSYLLDDKDHKDSIGWFASIIILAPLIGILFQYKKNTNMYLGSVNSKKIDKNIFNIKLLEQGKLMENIVKMFGDEQANYFFEMLFQGKSIEQYVLQSEIKRIFLQQLFEKIISFDPISVDYILYNLKNKSYDKIKSNVGEIPFLLITGQLKSNVMHSLNVDIKKIDTYCQEVFQVNLLRNIFLVPLSVMESSVFKNYKGFPISINFTTFTYSLNQNNDYKKNIDLNTISDGELRSVYDLGLTQNKFQKKRSIKFNLVSYDIKNKDMSLSLVDLDEKLNKKWNVVSVNCEKDVLVYKKLLDEHFFVKKIYDINSIDFSRDLKIMDSSGDFSRKLKEAIVANALIREKKGPTEDNFFVFVDSGLIYLVENITLGSVIYESFEEAKSKIIDEIISKRAEQFLELDINKIRYALEEKHVVSFPGWKKNSLVFKTEKKEDFKGLDNFYDLVLKKIIGGGLRVGSSFVERTGDSYVIYFVSEVVYDDSGEKDKKIKRKESFYNKELFIDSIERLAKIDIQEV